MDHQLPIKGSLRLYTTTSIIVALLMAVASIAGLVYTELVYRTEELAQSFVPNDVVNLAIGLPILLGSVWMAMRGRLLGLLFWPGALFFVFYNYLAYVFALPISWVYLLDLVVAVLSVYTVVGLAASIDGEALKLRLEGRVSEKFGGGVLAAFGTLFMLRVVAVVAGALMAGEQVPVGDMAASISDFFTSPAYIIVGVLLWRRKVLGYLGGLGLLFQASMLFIGLVAFLLLQPVLTSAPFALVDVIVVFLMGLICYVPFGLFIRGVVGSQA